ncbi:hypothetical protein ACFQY4_11580 [Catellatospora bangladeshensis]|uniref:hypothetical protein n=1 Tax=Catellatospora bangladeshensis TaxID=310355 RepID=UPI00361512C8
MRPQPGRHRRRRSPRRRPALPPLKEALARYGRLGFLSGITLRPAHLGTDAGLIGAAALIHAPDPYWPATPTR